MPRTKSSDERGNERLVKGFLPPRSQILCPECGESMSWESKPEVETRDGFPVATGLFWGKIWCKCGLVWQACPWPGKALPVPGYDPVLRRPRYLKKYQGGQRQPKRNIK